MCFLAPRESAPADSRGNKEGTLFISKNFARLGLVIWRFYFAKIHRNLQNSAIYIDIIILIPQNFTIPFARVAQLLPRIAKPGYISLGLLRACPFGARARNGCALRRRPPRQTGDIQARDLSRGPSGTPVPTEHIRTRDPARGPFAACGMTSAIQNTPSAPDGTAVWVGDS